MYFVIQYSEFTSTFYNSTITQCYSTRAHVILQTSVTKTRPCLSPFSRNTETFNSTAWFKPMDSMLQNWHLPQTSEDSEDFIFQQDGAPPHWHQDVWRFLNLSLHQRWIGRVGKEDLALQFWPPRSPDLTPCDFFLWGFVKEAVYVQSLPTTLDDLKNRITTAVNSVTQDILLRVWNEFSYRLDVTRAAGWGTLNIYKLHCEYNQMQFTSYLSLVLILKYRLTKLSPSFWITLYYVIMQ